MSDQPNLPGVAPTSTTIEGPRMIDFLLDAGGQIALLSIAEELEELRKQHPAAAGLTVALAVVQRDAAELQMKTSRRALSAAAKAGMPIDGHAIKTSFEGGRLQIVAKPEEGA